MACACKVNQEIEKIQKYYSYNKEKDKTGAKRKLNVNTKDIAVTMAAYLLLLPIMPFVFLATLLYSAFGSNKLLSFKKFLGFIHNVRNGRKQQVI